MHSQHLCRGGVGYSYGMENIAETEIDMVPVPGETPAEIAANYARLGNETFAKSETRYSRYSSEMLPFALRLIRLQEIAGSYFMEVERAFYYPPVRDREEEQS